MKMGDVHHLNNKTVSFPTHDPCREELDSLISMVYNMAIQKEENNRPFKPQIHQRKTRGQNSQNFGDRDRNRLSVEIQKDKILGLTIGDSHKIDIHIMDMTI